MNFLFLASIFIFFYASTDCVYVTVLESPNGSCSQKEYERVHTRMDNCIHQSYVTYSRDVQDYCIPVKKTYLRCTEEYANSNCWLNSQRAEIHRLSIVFGKLWNLFCNIKNVSSHDLYTFVHNLRYDIQESCPSWKVSTIGHFRLPAIPEEICSVKDCVKLNFIYYHPHLHEAINESMGIIFEGLECDKRPTSPKISLWNFEKYFTFFENNGTTWGSNSSTWYNGTNSTEWSNERNSTWYNGMNITELYDAGNSTSHD